MTKAPNAVAPFVVLVVGRPASGKTTISRAIADRWRLPVLSKDAVKEVLFDELGTADRAWSMKLGRTAFALLDRMIELQLESGAPFLIDAAYDADHEDAKFQRLQDRFGFAAVQVHCRASPDELVRRFTSRAVDGSRHPGHNDRVAIDEFRRTLADGRREVLELRGTVIEYDSEREDGPSHVLRALGGILPAS